MAWRWKCENNLKFHRYSERKLTLCKRKRKTIEIHDWWEIEKVIDEIKK